MTIVQCCLFVCVGLFSSFLKSVNVNCTDKSGDTALHHASVNGHRWVIILILFSLISQSIPSLCLYSPISLLLFLFFINLLSVLSLYSLCLLLSVCLSLPFLSFISMPSSFLLYSLRSSPLFPLPSSVTLFLHFLLLSIFLTSHSLSLSLSLCVSLPLSLCVSLPLSLSLSPLFLSLSLILSFSL